MVDKLTPNSVSNYGCGSVFKAGGGVVMVHCGVCGSLRSLLFWGVTCLKVYGVFSICFGVIAVLVVVAIVWG